MRCAEEIGNVTQPRDISTAIHQRLESLQVVGFIESLTLEVQVVQDAALLITGFSGEFYFPRVANDLGCLGGFTDCDQCLYSLVIEQGGSVAIECPTNRTANRPGVGVIDFHFLDAPGFEDTFGFIGVAFVRRILCCRLQ